MSHHPLAIIGRCSQNVSETHHFFFLSPLILMVLMMTQTFIYFVIVLSFLTSNYISWCLSHFPLLSCDLDSRLSPLIWPHNAMAYTLAVV